MSRDTKNPGKPIPKGDVLTVFYQKPGATNPDKKHWVAIGAAWIRDDGEIDVSIDSLPLSSKWDGKLKITKKKTT